MSHSIHPLVVQETAIRKMRTGRLDDRFPDYLALRCAVASVKKPEPLTKALAGALS